MTRITSGLLNDTLSLVQLARETALAQGKQDQAKRLTPVVEDLKNIAASARSPKPAQNGSVTGILAQRDFQALLAASKVDANGQPVSMALSAKERSQVVTAMSGGNMSEVEIARQMGMTREEVRLILSVSRKR